MKTPIKSQRLSEFVIKENPSMVVGNVTDSFLRELQQIIIFSKKFRQKML